MRRAWVVLAAGGLLAAAGCGRDARPTTTLRFWAMGREGEVVQELVRDFEREHAGIRVEVQQIPWTAAHEKLLTAFVGRSTPDLAQLGNTWIAEFVALRALAALDERVAASTVVDPNDQFGGVWNTNILDGVLYGIPWYVDTRVLFYRSDLLAAAGIDVPPATWDAWRRAMAAVARGGKDPRYGILLPLNEWTQPVILGLQAGSPLLVEHATRGAFSQPAFRRAFQFYVDLFRDGLAPSVSNNEVANLYQEFARGTFAMYITGPWNLGEFRRRLPAELQHAWATAALPAPQATPAAAVAGRSAPGLSLAGGSSLVIFRRSAHQETAWQLVEFLSRPAQQKRFFELTGNLPAHRAVWDDPVLAEDRQAAAFRRQLEFVVSTPKVPEWEQIADRIWNRAEAAIRGAATIDQTLAALDEDVARILAKRRWLLERAGDLAPTQTASDAGNPGAVGP
jgi:multiple sugar transport system substrate-binding protein